MKPQQKCLYFTTLLYFTVSSSIPLSDGLPWPPGGNLTTHADLVAHLQIGTSAHVE